MASNAVLPAPHSAFSFLMPQFWLFGHFLLLALNYIKVLWKTNTPNRGGIWILSPDNIALLTILVDEMEALRRDDARTGGWEVLGEGRRGSEGYLYLLHPGVDYVAEDKVRDQGRDGKEVKGEEGEEGEERGWGN